MNSFLKQSILTPLVNIMYNYFLKKATFLCFFAVFLFSPYGSSAAQNQKEMDILLMFYKEKDLVISPTRHPKQISRTAENITVITAKDIEQMNVHTVAEVLNRMPCLFLHFRRDFGANSLSYAQGSEERHMLVLMDGISWNFLSNGGLRPIPYPQG